MTDRCSCRSFSIRYKVRHTAHVYPRLSKIYFSLTCGILIQCRKNQLLNYLNIDKNEVFHARQSLADGFGKSSKVSRLLCHLRLGLLLKGATLVHVLLKNLAARDYQKYIVSSGKLILRFNYLSRQILEREIRKGFLRVRVQRSSPRLLGNFLVKFVLRQCIWKSEDYRGFPTN